LFSPISAVSAEATASQSYVDNDKFLATHRIGANLGEVRVTRSGVVVNAADTIGRIEHIIPADETYFSEAIYMAMNKAEGPGRQAGRKDVKGISAPIRSFHIPHFPDVLGRSVSGHGGQGYKTVSSILTLVRTWRRSTTPLVRCACGAIRHCQSR